MILILFRIFILFNIFIFFVAATHSDPERKELYDALIQFYVLLLMFYMTIAFITWNISWIIDLLRFLKLM